MTSRDVRDQLLADVWAEIRAFDAENVRNFPAAGRAIDSGAAPEDLARAMTAAAYEAVFQTLYRLTGEEDVGTSDLGMLHEDLLRSDPTGLEGNDLFD
jgi:hypothetical protein